MGVHVLIDDGTVKVARDSYFTRRMGRYGLSDADWLLVALEMRDALEKAAARRTLLSYRELTDRTRLQGNELWHRLLPEFLVILVEACSLAHLPMLTALVYGRSSSVPGQGFHDAARSFGYRGRAVGDDDEFWMEQVRAVYEQWSIVGR